MKGYKTNRAGNRIGFIPCVWYCKGT